MILLGFFILFLFRMQSMNDIDIDNIFDGFGVTPSTPVSRGSPNSLLPHTPTGFNSIFSMFSKGGNPSKGNDNSRSRGSFRSFGKNTTNNGN